MYAVIQTGGKQYRVAKGDRLRVEKIEVDTETAVELDRVLMVAEGEQIKVGTPYVDGGKVTAIVKEHGRNDKVKIIKFKRRKHYMKHQGHRQAYTLLEVTNISASGMESLTSEEAVLNNNGQEVTAAAEVSNGT